MFFKVKGFSFIIVLMMYTQKDLYLHGYNRLVGLIIKHHRWKYVGIARPVGSKE